MSAPTWEETVGVCGWCGRRRVDGELGFEWWSGPGGMVVRCPECFAAHAFRPRPADGAKAYTLEQHLRDVEDWWSETNRSMGRDEKQMLFFTAYERWLNNRTLLTEENAGVVVPGDAA